MLNFDICCCTYNSEKWLPGFFVAMEHINYDKKHIHIYITDNNSSDNTSTILEQMEKLVGWQYDDFKIIYSSENGGFGKGSNSSANAGNSEYVFFLNLDTALEPDALLQMENAIIAREKDFAAFEMRQFPYEHPKYYDPITLETPWASGAALVIKRDVFQQLGGFDESIFMYCEDVDFSWRIRATGYRIKYVPSAVVHHHMEDPTILKPVQGAGEIAGQKILRMKFGDRSTVKGWHNLHRVFLPAMETKQFPKDLAEKLIKKADKNRINYRKYYYSKIRNGSFKADFQSGYSFIRNGGGYKHRMPTTDIPFTVIICTYNRPHSLALTLKNLTYQTYKNFNVIVVEDGETPISGHVVDNFKNQLNISYIPLFKHVGRCAGRNTALETVKGGYVSFLDDDDYLFADYFEVMATLIEDNPNCKLFCSASAAVKTQPVQKQDTKLEYESLQNLPAKNIHRANFFIENPTPIQAVVFDISLFWKYGGFDLELDAFEDWDLWIRYSCACEIASVDKTLSLFRVPRSGEALIKREKFMNSFRLIMYDKLAQYSANFTAQEIRSLLWTPDMFCDDVPQQDFRQLKDTYHRIQNSTSYKIGTPFRIINYSLAKIFGCISSFFYNIGKVFGPVDNLKNEDYISVQQFVISAQDSAFIRRFKKLANSIKNNK